jgi:hypothetical protein
MLRAEVSGFVLNIFFEILRFNLANQRNLAFLEIPRLKLGVIYFSSSISIKINSVGPQPNANILIANLFFLRNYIPQLRSSFFLCPFWATDVPPLCG